MIRKVNIIDVMVSAEPKSVIIESIIKLLNDDRDSSQYICASSAHGIIESQKDNQLKQILNNAYIIIPDGLPLAKLGHMLGEKQMEQLKGPNLLPIICEITSKMNVRHFFYGGKDGIADKLANNMVEKYPGLKVSGIYCPPFRELSESEKDEISLIINSSNTNIVWVGLSTPKQEKWAAEFHKRLNVKMIITVGAAFDFHTDEIKFAPQWLCKFGLEWLFRLLSEPRRLLPRYFEIVPKFLFLALLQLLGIKNFNQKKG